MKKIFFALIVLLLPTVVLADDSTTTVVVVSDNGQGHNRNAIVLPVVTYSSDSNTLTVEFESEESYLLEVEDAGGTTWYSGQLNTSGIPTVYYVNLQPQNTYVIRISSVNHYFYGILTL